MIENQSGSQVVPWPSIRYTEVVLNYVEALIELGEEDEARTWLNKIRFRAGMPAITESGEALRDRYRNERRIELVYEEHRYHDARRWMIAAAGLVASVVAAFYYLRMIKLIWFDPAPGPVDAAPREAKWLAWACAAFSFPLVLVALIARTRGGPVYAETDTEGAAVGNRRGTKIVSPSSAMAPRLQSTFFRFFCGAVSRMMSK